MLYSASEIEILTAQQLAHHPFLQRVGPDVLDMTLTAGQGQRAAVIGEISQSPVFPACCWTGAFLAGLGNYLRVEILWQGGVDRAA